VREIAEVRIESRRGMEFKPEATPILIYRISSFVADEPCSRSL
jgi:hypothetical protein